MITWINEPATQVDFEIRKVKGPERYYGNPLDLMFSKEMIGQMILEEKNYTRAKKLEDVYKSMNEVINKSL